MRRVRVTVRDADALEAAYDLLLPRLPGGAYERELPGGGFEIAFEGGAVEAELGGLDLVADEAPRLDGGGWTIAGRIVVRGPEDPPPAPGMVDVVVPAGSGAFGDGGHPTTRACLALLAGIEPAGALADLGCGTGVIAVTAARLGFAPVHAVDADPAAVDAARTTAARNGAAVQAHVLDLLHEAPPSAPVVVANVPLAVHERLAASVRADHLIAAGFDPGRELLTEAIYEPSGLRPAGECRLGGWSAIHFTR